MMAVSPASENTVYIANSAGMLQSTDGGNTVTQLPGFPSVGSSWVTVDPVVPTQIYASVSNGGQVLVSQDSGNTWKQLGSELPLNDPSWMTVAGRNLYAGTGADVWEINLQSKPICSEVTFNPPSFLVPSAAGTYPLEMFITASCPWTATSSQPWATIQTNGQSTGHAIMYVTVGDNTSGSAAREARLTIAGKPVSVAQSYGPDPVQNGNVVTISRGSECFTVNG